MQDPAYVETMMDGMKKNMMNIIPQTVIMGWINFFFSGFVLGMSFFAFYVLGYQCCCIVPCVGLTMISIPLLAPIVLLFFVFVY